MNFSAWSIRNPVPTLMLFLLLTLGGLFSFHQMKVQNFPDIDMPMVNVVAALPGATPGQLENEVARKIENSLATVQGVKHISTSIVDGSVSIMVEFRLEKDLQEALDDVRSAVSRVRGDLPGDVREPIVSKLDLAAQPMLAYALSSRRMSDADLSWFVDNDIAKRLLAIPGVGAVNRVGGADRQVQVALDPVRLQGLGVTAADVSRQLRQVQMESAGGRVDLGAGEQPVRTLATVGTADELRALPIALQDGRSVRLDQVASVADSVAEPRAAALLNGQKVVGFEVARSRGASEVEVGAGVRAALAELRAAHPDLQFTEAFDFVTPVEEEYHASLKMLGEGAVLAVLVVWLFLRNGRATFVSAVALPMSVLPALIGMYFFGFSINIVSLLALSLVIGILVDDAIVEVENIVRHLRMGKSPYQAAMEAADEIGLAVIATTFTLIAVFLPTAFMSGVVGKFFKQFGWTASLAVFASLVVARMLTPMMAAYLMKPLAGGHEDPRWLRVYGRWAAWCVRHRLLTLLGALAFFIGSLALVPLLPTAFITPDDNSQTQVYLELPPGSTLQETERTAEAARAQLLKNQYIKSVYTTIGGGSAGGDPFSAGAADVRKATLTIQLAARGERPVKQAVEAELRRLIAGLPGVRSKIGLGGSGEKYILVLQGDDPHALTQAARAVESDLRTVPGLGSVTSTASLVRPEIAVKPDFARAADLGVTSSAIADTLRVATLGDYDAQLPKLNLAQRQIPIVVKLDADARKNLDVLARLHVPGSKGPVPLSQVAALSLSGGPAVINRYDRARNVNLEVELSGQPLGDVAAKVKELPSVKTLPAGVRVVEVGDAEVMGELFLGFGLAMLTGILCIYLVLVLLFHHVLHPITILAALPLSLGGAFVGLLLAGKSLSMPSLIGLIMLMGVATKNSILLVEYAILARREHGLNRFEALMDACHKRARPIIMTTLAMGAGMLPIAIGWGGSDPSFRSPMAVAVIGGLITSTFLSLLVIPAVFTYVDDVAEWVKRRWRGGGERAT
ncbi:efflux RND transporter permease subunit [Ottowia testudinis]|uniref:Efflux RND transporter permease subunit n=1 Tax=Ottowia testudinis TaxID=2816950 RepID=A0A975H3F0_9BURK|nr:efflux RND transporter permease subunit [Ottowia testudinis]QTD45195.1 efflux RND transporter permease subunit [Ottowia testudinis]